jgi:catechol 2,3-dioxygenase
MGHVHLRVSDIPETVAFYSGVLGFELMARLGDQAAFFATAGYHHNIGANTWESRGAGPAPDGKATLRHAVIRLPDEQARDAALARAGVTDGTTVTDPSGNRLVLIAGP